MSTKRFQYAAAYDEAAWSHQDVLADIRRVSPPQRGDRQSLMVATDSAHFNADTFRLAAATIRLPLDVRTTAYDTDRRVVLQRVDDVSYVVYREGGERVSPFNALGGVAVAEVRDSGKFVELPIARSLPDGGVAHVFANLRNARFIESGAFFSGGTAALDRAANIPSCSVTFRGRVRLTGFSIERAREGLRVQVRWQCLRPLDSNYRCFMHALDQHGGKANLDHEILNGEPPLTAWRAGDVALENLLIPFSDLPAVKSYRLRFGLYRPDTEERLAVGESTLPLTDGQTAVLATEAPQQSR
jgi:hypothetical protein